jgi:hypothetical protein
MKEKLRGKTIPEGEKQEIFKGENPLRFPKIYEPDPLWRKVR